jgi:flagellar assembly protein FliH
LSNIIKSHQVKAEHPRIIDTFMPEEVEATPTADTAIEPDPLQLARDELEKLKEESTKILAETETMVLELLEKARSDAKNIISDAQEEASVIQAQAGEEAETLRKQSQEQGYREGLKKAQEEIEADRQASLQQSQAILEEARQTKLKTLNSMEREIFQLVMAISKKVIAGEIATNPNVIVNVVKEALNFLDKPENITVYVNPHDLENLLNTIKTHEITEPGAKETPIEACALDRIKPGGCIVDSDIGRVDAQVETRLASVERALWEVVNDE